MPRDKTIEVPLLRGRKRAYLSGNVRGGQCTGSFRRLLARLGLAHLRFAIYAHHDLCVRGNRYDTGQYCPRHKLATRECECGTSSMHHYNFNGMIAPLRYTVENGRSVQIGETD